MKFLFLYMLIVSQSIFAQNNFDSLKISRKKIVDSLRNEIKKNLHNYNAIKEYRFYDDEINFTNSIIPKFYDSLFCLIEKNKNIRPEYFTTRANIFYSVGEERAKIFKKGFIRFPKDYKINSELGNYFYNRFTEIGDTNIKKLYADSAKFHLEKYRFKIPSKFLKLENAIKLYQVYFFQNDYKRMKKVENIFFNKPIYGISLNSFFSNDDLKTNGKAKEKVMDFFHYVENFNNTKKLFEINNKSKIYFNFGFFRSFFKPILMYLEENEGRYYLNYLISKKADEIEKPFKVGKKEISKAEYAKFINLLGNENLQKSAITFQPGYDGSYWYLESKTKNSHTMQMIWSPKINCKSNDAECSTIKTCLYLLELSGLKTISSKIHDSDYEYDPEEPEGIMIW